MDILSFLTVYNSYIKYIYYLLAIIIIIVLIMMFKKIIILANSSSKLLETQERIDAKLVEAQEKLTKGRTNDPQSSRGRRKYHFTAGTF